MRRLLHWFWAPVRQGETWAQTLVRVLGNLFRLALTSAAALAVWISIAVYFDGADSRKRQREAQLISFSVQTGIEGENANGCTADFPVAVLVENKSSLALMEAEIDLTARMPGTSTNVLEYGERRIHWDHIIPPQHRMSMCYQVGRALPSAAVYSASAYSYSMELREPEPWMLSETQASRISRFDRYIITPPCRDGAQDCEPWERDWPEGSQTTAPSDAPTEAEAAQEGAQN